LDQSEFQRLVAGDEIQEVTITGDAIGYDVEGKFKSPRTGPMGQTIKGFRTYMVKDDEILKPLRDHGVVVKAEKPRDSSFLALLLTWSPMLLFLGVWIVFMRQ